MKTQGENLSQRTADTLRQMILEKKVYTFGEKLPNENELSEKLGISRSAAGKGNLCGRAGRPAGGQQDQHEKLL